MSAGEPDRVNSLGAVRLGAVETWRLLLLNAAMDRRDPGVVMSEHVGLAEAPIGQVRDVVLAVPTGRLCGEDVPLVIGAHDDQYVTITGGPGTFRADVAGVPLTIEVDRGAGWVQARGQWWWCGRFQVEEHSDGTLIRQRTYNCGTGPAARLVPLTIGRGHRQRGRDALQRVLNALAGHLDCDVRLLSD